MQEESGQEQQRKDSVMNGSWIPSHLQLTVIQGRNLALKSKNVNSEVYVIVQLDKEKVSTALLIRDTHPTWNQTFEIPLMSFQSTLEVQVRQKSKFTDDHIGQLRIPVTNFTVSKRLHKCWYKLAARPGKISSKIRGDLLIATSFLSKWDTKEAAGSRDNSTSTTPDFNVPGSSGGKMLSRSKSESKSKSKNSPRIEKEKRRMFDRIRKSKSNAFEECEDFLVSVRTPNSPPTPPFGSERKKVESPLASSSDFNAGSLQSSSGNSFQMFSEATQLEKSGVLDLSRVDPKMRLELGKQRFVNSRTISRESDIGGRNDDEQDKGPTRSYSFRHKRPLRAQSLNQQQTLSSSFDSDHTHMTTPTMGTSTSNAVTSPNPSTVTTYRATTSIKRRKKLNGSMSLDQSPMDGDSMALGGSNTVSESASGNPLQSDENGRTQEDIKQKPFNESSNNEVDSPSNGQQQTISLQISDVDGNPIVPNQEEPTNSVDGPLQSSAGKREKSVPTESHTLQQEEVQLRKTRRRFASETMDRKRHSADIESLLRLTTPQSPGKHDGLGNVLNTNQIKMKLKHQLTPERGQDNIVSLSQPVDHVTATSPPTNATPPPNTASYLVNSQQDLPGLISPTDSDRSEGDPPITPLDQSPQSGSGSGGLIKAESLPAIKRAYQWDNRPDLVYPKMQQPPRPIDLDKATFFESEGSLSTVSNLYPPSNISSSLDSSYSSDYASLSNNRRLDDDNPSDSQCTTPTDATPTITREGTPSPQEHSPLIENVINKENHKPIRRAQHTYIKPISKENDVPPPLLPPSLKYSTLPTRGKYANSIKSSDTTDLVSAAAKVLAPYEDSKGHQHHHAVDHHLPPNIRPSLPMYSLSASNSGRTSPVLEEPNEEDPSHDIRDSPTTIVTTPLSNSIVDKTSDSISKSSDGKIAPAGSLPMIAPDTQKTKVRRKLPSATSYESSSLQRRKPSSTTRGGGLMKTISLYQDNKRLNSGGGGAKRALFRGHSLDVENEKSSTTKVSTTHVQQRSSPRKLPMTTGTQKRRSRDEPSNTKPTSHSKQTITANRDSPKTITNEESLHRDESSTGPGSISDALVPTSNGNIPSNHDTGATSNSNQFSLPPPPDVSHTSVAEHLCGMNQSKQTSNTAEREELSQSDDIPGADSNTKGDWRSSQSTIATSSDEYEEILEDELERLSKQELIHLVVEVNEKFKKSKQKVTDIQQYLDKLLVKVMEHHPELLCSL